VANGWTAHAGQKSLTPIPMHFYASYVRQFSTVRPINEGLEFFDLICEHCSTPIPDSSRFCLSCGADLSDPNSGDTRLLTDHGVQNMEQMLREDTRGDFEIVSELGRGGMAVVYLATEVRLRRKVAIKVLPPELTFGKGTIDRFVREAQTAAGLDHPNIIPIYRISSGQKLFWYAMKFVEGRALDEILKEKGLLDLPEVLQYLRQVSEALEWAHRRDVVHRDIKPANIMIDEQGRAIVADFGIAKALTAATLTASGSAIGTPFYMSPEQCMGGEVTGAADQYSLAVMVFQMLSGRLPFEADSAVELIQKHCFVPPPPLAEFRPGLPGEVYETINRALSKKAEERFPTVTEFLDALKQAGDQGVAEKPSPRTAPVVRPETAEPLAEVSSDSPVSSDMPTVPLSETPTTPISKEAAVRKRKVSRKKWGLIAVLVAVVVVGGVLGVAWWAESFDGSSSEPFPGEVRWVNLVDGVTIPMVWIPPGQFTMGSPDWEDDRDQNEGPAHTVYISSGFWMSSYEITQGEWYAVMGENPAKSYGVGDYYPVHSIEWDDVKTFLTRLDIGFRLPTEAEWEYAARAGSTTRFYWGDDPDYAQTGLYAVYGVPDSGSSTVGSRMPNSWGLYDIIGNVTEFVEDDYHGSYDDAPAFGTAWINQPRASQRVLRGCSWFMSAPSCRSASRFGYAPNEPNYGVGFRLVFMDF